MSVRERVVRGRIASEHVVQFFDSDESRSDAVATFLAEGYEAGEPAIVVARPGAWTAVFERLAARGIPVQQAIAECRFVVRDAAETLRRISRGGSPDAEAFDAILGTAVSRMAAEGTRVRAYGEMVDLLAQRGEIADAVTLEAMWNQLGERTPFFLMCGYSAAHFVASATHRALREICASHTDVHRHAHDPLASWLLNTAHNAPGAAAITH